jgi:hypothetical protein
MALLEFVVILLLAVSIPFWEILIPIDPSQTVGFSPVVLAVFFTAAGLNLAGLLMSAPRLRSLPRLVWNGWSFGHTERTPSLPDISEPWLGVVYAPLFNPQKIRAGRMLIRGLDTTAALFSCVAVLLCAGALLASSITGESSSTVYIVSILLMLSLVLLSVSTGLTVFGIGRLRPKEKKHSGKSKSNEKASVTDGVPASPKLPWLLQLPYLVCLYGFAASIMPLLSLHLDQTPVNGLTAILYLVIRACLLTLILMLLFHAPRKLMVLSSGKPCLTPWVVYAVSFVAFFIWLLLDWFFLIP